MGGLPVNAIRVPVQAGRDTPRPTALQLRVRHVYAADERPDVLVQVDGEWHRGVLRKWSQDVQGGWWGSVAWGRTPGTRFLDTFPGDLIWEDTDEVHPGD
ncbi:MAG: hypothetical protein AVDCRST_MAG32-1862 [uncultured Nocardioides sp.]|uniref:Uncharacterized protein n=1 Tax=uncultured Nocardioides sp. TaxID=198441 RepID=A0A6J4NCB2_9ACTN|nr:MAG: hypothetical protein AVDCRST_MAG32-1862 [uncultured Nocardioides sp.]